MQDPLAKKMQYITRASLLVKPQYIQQYYLAHLSKQQTKILLHFYEISKTSNSRIN